MKEYLLALGCLFSLGIGHAQFGPERIITTEANGAREVFVIDLDGDNRKDVLSASSFDDKIAWYRNLDGYGNFSDQQVIGLLDENRGVYAADLDGDTDVDVLATSVSMDQLVWYENLDGLGNFGAGNIIFDGTSPLGAYDVKAADLDGDTDIDVILSSDSDGLMWFGNLDGQGSFGSANIVSNVLSNCRSVFVGNLDGDGDLDLLANSSGSENLFWFRNLDGQGNFGSPQFVAITTTYPAVVHAADLDGDNDLDVLTAINANNIIAWHENINGFGSFGPEQVISDQAEFALSVFAADLDNDLDNDVISASSVDDKVAWYENEDGLGDFGAENVLNLEADSARSVYAADIDNDGDMDVFSASRNDHTVSWYENLTILGVEEFDATMVEIVPNPVDNILSIRSEISIDEVVVYDVLGKELLRKKGNISELNVSGLPSGLLFLELITPQGLALEKVVKE